MHEVKVQQLMSREVVTLSKEQSIPLAHELMRLRRIRHIPVVDHDDRLVGIVTHRDLLAAQISALSHIDAEEKSELQLSVPVAKVMRTEVWVVSPQTSALEAAKIMLDHNFGCLPVVDDGRLVGILTEADFLSLLVEALENSRRRAKKFQI